LYVCLISPSRFLVLESGVGRMNITVALSTLTLRSCLACAIACQAKLRSKYSFFADSRKKEMCY
jgi:hypothetical protein